MLVVILFLQTWRASIIPLIAVPVSVVGTFAVLYLLGFSINTLTLFGLVLAIGIVVDDAIVVVENVERNIEEGRTPLEAAHQAMTRSIRADRRDRARAVRGVRADGVPDRRHRPVLQAVRSDDRDLDGDLGDQFADLVAGARRQTAAFARRAEGYAFARDRTPVRLDLPAVQPLLQGELRHATRAPFRARSARRGVVFVVYVVLLVGTGLMFNAVPRGFIPTQDKLYLIAGVKLPEGSSLERTDAVLQRMKDIALGTDGVAHVIGADRFQPAQQFTNTPNYAVAFPILKPFNERHRSAKEIAADIQAKIAEIKEGFAFVLIPPPVLGLGQGAGYSLFVEDRAGAGLRRAPASGQRAARRGGARRQAWAFPSFGYQSNVPQLDIRGRSRQGQGAGRGR